MEISLDKLFLEAFGYQTDAFNPTVPPVFGGKSPKRVPRGMVAQSPYYGLDSLGREYFMPITVQVGKALMPGTQTTYAEHLGVTDDKGNPTGQWMLPFPVMSITTNKRIVDTNLTERNGPVSELINIEGYKITVRGFLINQDSNEFPEDDFTTMIRLYEMNIPVQIKNPVTDVLFLTPGTTTPPQVTLRNLQFPERPGVKHVKPYTLEMWSDEDFNLIDIS